MGEFESILQYVVRVKYEGHSSAKSRPIVTSDDFRKIALSMPDAAEAGHMDHPDFRIHGKIFATLGYPNHEFGMLKLTPDEQVVLVAAHPSVFAPANGAWGRNGSTLVRLAVAREAFVRGAMELACDAARAKPARTREAKRNGSRK